MSSPRNIAVLGLRDALEAVRVAAGITIFGHQVKLVLMRELPRDGSADEHLELIELAEVEAGTTLPGQPIPHLDTAGLQQLLTDVDAVLTL